MGGSSALFGFYYKGKYYLASNRCDSYPSGLGYRLIMELADADLDEWTQLLENSKEVSDDIKPTPEEIKKLKKYTYSKRSEYHKDWFHLLYFTQGSFYNVLHCGYIRNVVNTVMFDEYHYVLDLDNKEFRGKGVDLDVVIPLERDELIKYAYEWIGGFPREKYDPEIFLRWIKKLEGCN